VADLADYLDLTAGQAREQFRALASRRPARGGRQVAFVPVETLLCLAASFLVNHRHFGGSTAHQAPEPVPSLARLFSGPPSSVLAKMANLDGSRSHGARWDALAGAMLRDDPTRFSRVYRVLLAAARAEGIGPGRLPDSLGLEHGGELAPFARPPADAH
jgi:putative restriction endonuclease